MRTVSWLGRALRAAMVLALALGLVLVAAIAGLAWRLSQGPLEMDWAARHAEAAVNRADSATRLSVGSVAVQWGGFEGGAERGLEVRVRDVHLREDGRDVATVREAEAVVSVSRMLLGQLAPRAVSAAGVELALTRDAAGELTLDLGGLSLGDDDAPDAGNGPSLAESMAELSRPAARDGTSGSAAARHLQQLRRVQLHESVIRLHDRRLGSARIAVTALDLARQPSGGVRGTAAATVLHRGAQASLVLEAALAPSGGTQVQVALAPLAAGAVQRAIEDGGLTVAPGGAVLDAAVQASGSLLLTAGLQPIGAALKMEAGGGRLRVAGVPIGFDSLSIEAQAGWTQPGWTTPDQVTLQRGKAVLHAPGGAWPTTLTASGSVQRGDMGRLAGSIDMALDHVAFADLGSLWPPLLGGHVRPWLVQNLTAGTARDGSVKLAFDASADLREVRIVSIDARLVGEETTISWLRPVPPIERAQAVLTMKTPESLEISIVSGRQGALALKNGLVRITGLDVKDQFLALSAEAAGGVPELLTLLRHPRLRLLDRKPIPIRNPGGAFNAKLGITLPLIEHLDFDDVRITAQGRFSELRLGGLVAGRDLDRGDVLLDVTSDALKATGTAAIGGIPAEIVVEMEFRGGPPGQVVQRAQATGRATARQLAAVGLDPGGLIEAGTGRFVAKYAQKRDTTAELLVNADLREAGLALVGWRKSPGQPAEASARVLLRGERLLGIDQLRAQGPGMVVEGRAEMVGNRPLNLMLDRIVLGPTQARGVVRFPAVPNEPIAATLEGTVLDLSTEFGKAPAGSPPKQDASPGQAWVADVRFERVLLAGQRGVGSVTAHAEHDGRRLVALKASSTGSERIEATIRAEGASRRVSVRAADGGALLRAFDVVDTVVGGRLALDAVYDDSRASAPLTGAAELSGFHVRNAPGLGKLLQALTIYGVVEALSGPGLAFTEATMPFRWEGGLLDVMDARAFSASLGLTGKGRVDTNRGTVDMQGTIVPAYVLNSLLGRIPLLGRLFSAERGGGLVAVNYTLRGPLANYNVSVNPLSALTPGFLRGLFSIMD